MWNLSDSILQQACSSRPHISSIINDKNLSSKTFQLEYSLENVVF